MFWILVSDFLIVACASVKEIPVVVSEDNHTLASELAIKAYILVNQHRNVPKPQFIRYKESLLRRGSDPLINSSQKFGIFLSFF